MKYDAILLVSFGGPEYSADVLPFLENRLRGRNVPRERMLQVAEQLLPLRRQIRPVSLEFTTCLGTVDFFSSL